MGPRCRGTGLRCALGPGHAPAPKHTHTQVPDDAGTKTTRTADDVTTTFSTTTALGLDFVGCTVIKQQPEVFRVRHRDTRTRCAHCTHTRHHARSSPRSVCHHTHRRVRPPLPTPQFQFQDETANAWNAGSPSLSILPGDVAVKAAPIESLECGSARRMHARQRTLLQGATTTLTIDSTITLPPGATAAQANAGKAAFEVGCGPSWARRFSPFSAHN
jgi:hypothetical protein